MTWVTSDVKSRFDVLARAQGLSESGFLRALALRALASAPVPMSIELSDAAPLPKDMRIAVRLRPNDLRLLRERAGARELATGSYVALLVRSHLTGQALLPTAELQALKAAIVELAAIGRNLNQLAKAAHRGDPVGGPSRADLMALLRACVALRDHIKELIQRNISSWEAGHETKDG